MITLTEAVELSAVRSPHPDVLSLYLTVPRNPAPRGRCPDCGAAALPVPDLFDEMVARTLDDGGQVHPVQDGLSRVAVRHRFPVAR